MDIEHENFYDSIRAKGPRFQLPRNLQTDITSTEIIHTFCNVLFEAWTAPNTKEFSYCIVSLDNFNSVFFKSWDMLVKHNKPPRKIKTFTVAFDNDNYITLKYSTGYRAERFLVLSETLVRLLAELYSKRHKESDVWKEPLMVSLKLSSLPGGLIDKIKKNIDNPYEITYGPSAKQLFETYLLPEIENPYMLLGHALKLAGIKDIVERMRKSTKNDSMRSKLLRVKNTEKPIETDVCHKDVAGPTNAIEVSKATESQVYPESAEPDAYYDKLRGPLNICCGLDSLYCGCYIIGDAYVPQLINYELVSIRFETAGDNYKVRFGKYAYDPMYSHVYKTGNLPMSLPSDESTRCRKMNLRNYVNEYGSNEIMEHPYLMALPPETFRYWRSQQKIKFDEDENLSPIPVMRQEKDFNMSLLDATIVYLNQEEIEVVFEHLCIFIIDYLIPLPEGIVSDVVNESDSETIDLSTDLTEYCELHINNEIDENDDESDWSEMSENKKSVAVQTDSQMYFDNTKYAFPFKIECIIEVHREINQPILDTTDFLYNENVNFIKLISTDIDERIRNSNVIRFQSPKCAAIALKDYSIGVLLEDCSVDTLPIQILESVQIIGDSVQNKFAGLTGFRPFYFKKLQRSLITSIDDFPSTQVDKKKITSLFNETKSRLHLDSLHTISILWISSKNLELYAIYWQKGTNELHVVLNKDTTSKRKYKINCMFFENSISSKKISNIKFGTMEALQMEISQTKKIIIKINPQNKPLLIIVSDIYVWNKKLRETLQDIDIFEEVTNEYDETNKNGSETYNGQPVDVGVIPPEGDIDVDTTERRHASCRVLRKAATKPPNYYNENSSSNDFVERLQQQKQFTKTTSSQSSQSIKTNANTDSGNKSDNTSKVDTNATILDAGDASQLVIDKSKINETERAINAECNILAQAIEDPIVSNEQNLGNIIQTDNTMESCSLRVMLEDFYKPGDGINDEIINNKPQIKRSLPLQKRYAIVQQISRENRSKNDKMFLKTDCSKIIPNPHTHFRIVNNKVRKVYVNGKPPLKRKIAGSSFKKRADNNVSQSTVAPQKSKGLQERKFLQKNGAPSTPKTRAAPNPKNSKTSFRTNRFYHSHNKISPKKQILFPDPHDLYANNTPSRPQIVYDDLITNIEDDDPLAVEHIENSASQNNPEQSEYTSSQEKPTDIYTELVDGVVTIRFNDNIFDILEQDVTENRHNQHDKSILIDPESVETNVDENITDNVLSQNNEEGGIIGSAIDTTMVFISEDMINVNNDRPSTESLPSSLIANEPIPISTEKDINPGEEYVVKDLSLENIMFNYPNDDSIVVDNAPKNDVIGSLSAVNNQINKKRKQQRTVYKNALKGILKENLINYKETTNSLKKSSNETFNIFDTRNVELSSIEPTTSQDSPTSIDNQFQIDEDVNFELTANDSVKRDEVLRNDVQWMTCSPRKQHSPLLASLLKNDKEPETIDLTSEEFEPLLEEPVFKRPKLFPRIDLFQDSNVNQLTTEDITEINQHHPNSGSWSSDPESMLLSTHSNESILRPLLQEAALQTNYDSSQSFIPVPQTYMPNDSNRIQSNFVRNEFPPHALLDYSVSALQHSSNLTNRMSTHDQHVSFAPTVSNSRHNSRTRIAPTILSNNTYARIMNVPGRYSTSLPRPRPVRVIPKRPTNTGDSVKNDLFQFYKNLNSCRIGDVFLSSINLQNSRFRSSAATSNTYYPPLEYERFVGNPQFFSEIQESPLLQSQPYARMVPYERIYPPTTFQECDTLRNRQLFNGERTYYQQFPHFNYGPLHRRQFDVFCNSNNKH